MTDILLIRHGETEWNAAQRVQGHTDSPLSALGRRQAVALGERLRDVTIAAVYASDLGRAQDTAAIVTSGRELAVREAPALREKNYGHWEGRSLADVQTRHADEWHAYHVLRNVNFRIPGAEIWPEVQARVAGFLEEVAERHRDDAGAVVLVGHGGSIRVAVLHALGAPIESLPRLKLDNCGLTRITRDDEGRWRLITMNDTGHLAGVV